MGNIINFNKKVGNAIVGDNNHVTLRVEKKTKNKYPGGSLGANNDKANYIGYLITRYHEYKEWEIGKENMNYAIFQSKLKRKFKIGKTRTLYNVPEINFDELSLEIQKSIDNTALAKVNRSKNQLKNYSSCEEYLGEIKP